MSSSKSNTSFERHDGSGPLLWLFEVACVTAAVGLVVLHATRFLRWPEVWHGSTLAVILLAWPAADFMSGIVHWLADTWGSEDWPVIGRRFLHPFRLHHVNPRAMLRCGFFDTNGDTALICVLVLLAVFAIPLDTTAGRLAAVFLTAFCCWGLPTNQIHYWAHMSNPPRLVRWLQQAGLILSPEHHAQHHTAPHATHYCIVTGWCNWLLATVGFFAGIEWCVQRLTGLKPRAEILVSTTTTADARCAGGHVA